MVVKERGKENIDLENNTDDKNNTNNNNEKEKKIKLILPSTNGSTICILYTLYTFTPPATSFDKNVLYSSTKKKETTAFFSHYHYHYPFHHHHYHSDHCRMT